MIILKEVCKELNKENVFHKINKTFIITKKTKVKIPKTDKEIAYLVGVIAGDGTLIKSKRKKGGNYYEVKIYANSKDYLRYINTLFKKLFEYSGKVIKDKRKKQTYILVIKNAAVYSYFRLLDSKFISNNLPKFTSNNNLLRHYIAGLIDTDGSISGKRVQLKLKNKEFIENLYKKLKEIKTNVNPPRINYTNSIPFYYLRFDNIFPLRLK